jgi:MFS family permease
MLIGGIVLGLVLGLLAGGSFGKLARIHLRWVWILFAAVVVRFGTEALINAGVEVVDAYRMPLLLSGFALLLIGLWVNRHYAGILLAFVGILLNAIVITITGGYMPIWAPSLRAAGFTEAEVTSALHVVVGGGLDVGFVVRALFIADILPIPIPLIRNVASLGDLFLTFGLAFFLFSSVLRTPTELDEEEQAAVDRRIAALAAARRRRRPQAGMPGRVNLAPGLLETSALERPLVLGSPGTGLAGPALTPLPVGLGDAEVATAEGTAVAPPISVRVRRHPYVRLALNPSFSALWAGQLISLFGDRIHQMALAAVVLGATGSALASALVFVAATLPNLLFSPVAGALVDRWDRKEVLVVSDILRAAAVLLVPVAAVTNIYLVYPLVFLVTTISIFFRPARVAILPQIVEEDELLTANSAMWVGETMADAIGYPLAGIFVVALGSALPLAFWLDAVTYLASAILLSTIVVGAPHRTRRASDPADGEAAAANAPGARSIVAELKDGWRFLRGEPTLLANTVQATVAQLTVGVVIALTPVYALTVFGGSPFGWEAVYSFVEASQSLGNLVGGFAIGLIGTRLAKGRMIISGYTVFGFLLFLLAMSGNLAMVLGLAFGSGIANMAFLIPSQTLFQERTPAELMGRVVGFRFSLVFGAMTLAMALGGVLADIVGVTTVIAVSGLVSMAAGLAGLAFPALRDA